MDAGSPPDTKPYEVLDVQETVKKDEAKELFRYL